MGYLMSGFIEGESRAQATLFPDRLDDYLTDENEIRVIDAFINHLVLSDLGFKTVPADTGRPGYHPSTMLKLFVYGYLNRIQSSRRLEREAGRNVELMWLLGRLTPDFKTIADFRKDNGKSIKNTCRACELKPQCSNSKQSRRIARGEHQDQIDCMDDLMSSMPDTMLIRKQTVEHPFGTIKSWMGATHFLTKRLPNVSTEMSLHVLTYNLKRMISIPGQDKLIAAMAA